MLTFDDATYTDLQAPASRDRFLRFMTAFNVPVEYRQSLADYLVDGHPLGSFLAAVVDNDLREAIARADLVGRRTVYELVTFLHNHAPALSWGRAGAVAAWCAAHAARRRVALGVN